MKPGSLPVYPNIFIRWQFMVGGMPHASVKNITDRKKDFRVLMVSPFGSFLNLLNLKIKAGRIVATRKTFTEATKTFLIFH
jgi:hypothetical protein